MKLKLLIGMFMLLMSIALVTAEVQEDSGAPHELDYSTVGASAAYSENVTIDGASSYFEISFDADTNMTLPYDMEIIAEDDEFGFDFGLLFSGHYYFYLFSNDHSTNQLPSEFRTHFIVDATDIGIKLLEPHLGVSDRANFPLDVETDFDALCHWGLWSEPIADYDRLQSAFLSFYDFNQLEPGKRHKIDDFKTSVESQYGDVGFTEGAELNVMVICAKDLGGEMLYEYRIFNIYYDLTPPTILSISHYPEPVKDMLNPVSELTVETDDTTVCYMTETTDPCVIKETTDCYYADTIFKEEDYDVRETFTSSHLEIVDFGGLKKGTSTFDVVCRSANGKYSEVEQISISVDPTEAPDIEVVKPSGYVNDNPVNLTIRLDKQLNCEYRVVKETPWTELEDITDFEKHDMISGLSDGNYTIEINCESIAIPGKEYFRESTFTLDTTRPDLEINVRKFTCTLAQIVAQLNGTDLNGILYYNYSLYEVDEDGEEEIILENITTTTGEIVENMPMAEGDEFRITATAVDSANNPSALTQSILFEASYDNQSICDNKNPVCDYFTSTDNSYFTLRCRDEFGCKDYYYFMQTPYGNTEEEVSFTNTHKKAFKEEQIDPDDSTLWGKRWISLSPEKLEESKTVYYQAFDTNGKECSGRVHLSVSTNGTTPIDDDYDNDGILNDQDNCPIDPNYDQSDIDGDDQGDVCDADDDNDDVDDEDDNCPVTPNPDQEDTDGDGVGDVCDANTDTDGDGVDDGVDNCVYVPNGNQEDDDGDNIGNACDTDRDNDGIDDEPDNCPDDPNPGQEDDDADGIGNVCDESIPGGDGDSDDDGIPDEDDNCPVDANNDQSDNDNDGKGDVCDADDDNDGIDDPEDSCPIDKNAGTDSDGDGIDDACDTDNDRDNDGIDDGTDNCPDVPNQGQDDEDEDGIGDACDNDRDNDGIVNSVDNCPEIPNVDQADADNDGIGDVCEDEPPGEDLDADKDGIKNDNDNCPLTPNNDQQDTDGDGLGDVCDADDDNDDVDDEDDNCPKDANPSQSDSDDDGIGNACDLDSDRDDDGVDDGVDNCVNTPNSGQGDSDDDGIGDACDNDRDNDGVPDATDNCVNTPNADQKDADKDGVGDACDRAPPIDEDDVDGDGIDNEDDNCEVIPNNDQSDNDGDGAGDVCDDDDDDDTVPDPIDNCPLIPNTNQEDEDLDGVGDVCDTGIDRDDDGIDDGIDNCPGVPNPDQKDADTDGIGDACDNDADNDGVTNQQDNCPNTPNANQQDTDGDGIGDACDEPTGPRTDVPPVIIIQEPYDGGIYNILEIPVRITAYDDNIIESVWFTIEDLTTGDNKKLPVNQVYTSELSYTLSDMTEYKISASARDEYTNMAETTATFSINTSDKGTVPPVTGKFKLDIISPGHGKTYDTTSIVLNISATDPHAGIAYQLNDRGFVKYDDITTLQARVGENILSVSAVPIKGDAIERVVIFTVNGSYENTCENNIKDAGEAGVDCGGLTECPPCGKDSECSVDFDCSSGYCDEGICKTAPCIDGKQNGDETGIDCGGPICSACKKDQGCKTNDDCINGICEGGACVTQKSIDCYSDADCTGDLTCSGGFCVASPSPISKKSGILGLIFIIIGALLMLGGGGYFGYEYYYEHVPPVKSQRASGSDQDFSRPMPSSRSPSRSKPQKPAKPAPRLPTARDKIHSNLKRYKRNSLFDEFDAKDKKEKASESPSEKKQDEVKPVVTHIEKPKETSTPKPQAIPKTQTTPAPQQAPVKETPAPAKEVPKTPAQKKLAQKKKETFGELDELLEEDSPHAPKDLDELTKDD